MISARFCTGLSLLSFSTLLLEIVETRLLSVVSWYHLAFFVISAAMFGMTAGAVWVYVCRDRFTAETLTTDLAHSTAAFAVTMGLSLCVQVTFAPAMVFSASTVIVFAEMALAMATPFFFSGVAVTLALTRSPFPVGRVYAVDLVGAALGCMGVIAFLDIVDAPSAILLTGAVAATAAALFAGSGRSHARPIRARLGATLSRPFAILLVMAALGAANGAAGARMLRFDGDQTMIDFLAYDGTNLACFVRRSGRAAVIGVGSGRDILSAADATA